MEIVDISKIFRQDSQSEGQWFSTTHLYRHPLAASCILNDSRQRLVLIWPVRCTRTYFIFLDVHLTVRDIPKVPKRLHCWYCLPLFIGLMQKPFGGCMSDLQIQISWATNMQCWKHKVERSGNVCWCVFVNVPVSGFVRGILSAPKQLCHSVSCSCIFFQRHCICAQLSENRQVQNISVFSGLWVSLNEFGWKAINTWQRPDVI